MQKWWFRITPEYDSSVSGFRSPEGQMLWRRGKSYSQDLRERVFAAADDGEPVGRIATVLRVSVSYVSKVLSRRRLTGQTTVRPNGAMWRPS
jgi:hypothetical protein